MLNLFVEGGVEYMFTITLLLLIVLVLAGVAAYKYFARLPVSRRLVESIRQVGMLALVWGIFSTVLAFFQALRALSELEDPLPFNVIMGGLKVALITSLYGMVVFLMALSFFIGLQFLMKKKILE